MGAAATLSLPRVTGLQERATSFQDLRRKIESLEQVTWAVENKWYELPYDLRLEIMHLKESIDSRISRPQTFAEWFNLALTPVCFLWSSLTGERILVHYATAMADLFIAISGKMLRERDEAQKLWLGLGEDDDSFLNLYLRSREAGADSYKRFDWTTISTK